MKEGENRFPIDVAGRKDGTLRHGEREDECESDTLFAIFATPREPISLRTAAAPSSASLLHSVTDRSRPLVCRCYRGCRCTTRFLESPTPGNEDRQRCRCCVLTSC